MGFHKEEQCFFNVIMFSIRYWNEAKGVVSAVLERQLFVKTKTILNFLEKTSISLDYFGVEI
jgi:hypothetical protein